MLFVLCLHFVVAGVRSNGFLGLGEKGKRVTCNGFLGLGRREPVSHVTASRVWGRRKNVTRNGGLH